MHVWAGISWKGRTPIIIFDGTMNAEGYETILEKGLIPFLHDIYPCGHCLMQDNDPKHTSNQISHFLDEKRVNWCKTPPELPDCNLIRTFGISLKSICEEKYTRNCFLRPPLGAAKTSLKQHVVFETRVAMTCPCYCMGMS